jgi:hypothetical protein
MVIDFFFSHLIDGVVYKLIGVIRQGLHWANGSVKVK